MKSEVDTTKTQCDKRSTKPQLEGTGATYSWKQPPFVKKENQSHSYQMANIYLPNTTHKAKAIEDTSLKAT